MPFEVDGIAPASVLRPSSIEELAENLSSASTAGEAVVPWGGGTRMHVGNKPDAYDTGIDLSGLPLTIEHVAGDMVCIVSANATIGQVQEELAKAGQRLPFDVPDASHATIGGSLASNAPGRMRSSSGGIRDWVIGLRVMLPDGTVAKSGGRVVKNVQGFDLHRLHTGAFGTLGIIVEAGFKLVPTAAVEQTVAAWFDDLQTAREYSMSLFNGSFMPEALTLVTGAAATTLTAEFGESSGQQGTRYLVLARMAGFESAVTRMVNDATGLAGTTGAAGYLTVEPSQSSQAWRRVDEVESDTELGVRASLRPSEAFDVIDHIEQQTKDSAGADSTTVLDVGFGGLHIGFNSSDEDALTKCLTDMSGRLQMAGASFVAEQMPSSLKSGRDVFGNLGANINVMRRLKTEFDPNKTLNRGRFAGGL